MGIRFFCPNGHKLHVKAFQAGLKGICPTCGAKMLIPWESTRLSSKEEKAQPHEGGASSAIPIELPPAAAKQPPVHAVSNPSPSPPFAAPPADPLAEAGDVVWYVRPASGGQFGPANSAIMQGWIAEGRVSAEALIWREGWRDWQQASQVFPQLAPQPPAPELTIPGLENILEEEPLVVPGRSRPRKSSLQKRNQQAVAIGSIVLAVLLVLVISLVVWFLK
jgi:hypothetical protein